MKKVKSLLFLIIAPLILSGCLQKDEEESTPRGYFYDPQVPFGEINNRITVVNNVKKLVADNSLTRKIKLTWEVPSLYTTLDYQIEIFKRRNPPAGFNIVCPDPVGTDNPLCPQDEASAVVLYKVATLKGNQWTDQNEIDPVTGEESVVNVDYDTYYSYWVFIQVDGVYSTGVRVDTQSKGLSNSFVMPDLTKFWENTKWSYGQNPTFFCSTQSSQQGCLSLGASYGCSWVDDANAQDGGSCQWSDQCSAITVASVCRDAANVAKGCSWDATRLLCEAPPEKYQSLYTLEIGQSLPGKPKGGIAFAGSGNIMFVADTDNNRVMIYKRAGALNCQTFEDPIERSACMLQYAGAPIVASNVLGQTKADRNFPCGHSKAPPSNQCMTSPTKVVVDGERLLVSDSGNNRILVYSTIPHQGCDPAPTGVGTNQPTNCVPGKVIGKAGLEDLQNYTVEATGDSTLNYPTDMVTKDGDLYIADTGNNRVVKINNYNSPSSFLCNAQTWGGQLCKFSAVLGQENFFSKRYFEEMVAENPAIISSEGLRDLLVNDHQFLLRKYFRNPTRVVFDSRGNLLVGANERFSMANPIGGRNSIHGRVLIFNGNPLEGITPRCNPATFHGEDAYCDAVDVIGQSRFDKLENVSSQNMVDYNELSYGMFNLDDFDVKEILPNEEQGETESKIMLLTLDSGANTINYWADIKTKGSPGYPKTGAVVNPLGRYLEDRQVNLPNLQNLCSIRIVNEFDYIYLTDCSGHRVHEVQAYQY